MKKLILGTTGMIALAGALMLNTTKVQAVDKVTVCHADGRDGTIKYSVIVVSPSGAAAHLDPITGTPTAGHENDVLGADGKCPAPPPPPK
jgi:hypothetical protein